VPESLVELVADPVEPDDESVPVVPVVPDVDVGVSPLDSLCVTVVRVVEACVVVVFVTWWLALAFEAASSISPPAPSTEPAATPRLTLPRRRRAASRYSTSFFMGKSLGLVYKAQVMCCSELPHNHPQVASVLAATCAAGRTGGPSGHPQV
jgi:hypothetical protein